VSVFCNLAASLAPPRLPECIHEADEEALPRPGLHWFVNIGGGRAGNPINSGNHLDFPFRKTCSSGTK
jgi:hypothetical protein